MSAAYERPTGDEMVALGQQLWGEPNKAQSTTREVRFGSNGSKCIKLDDLVWFDYEANEGGGFADLWRKVHPKADPRPTTQEKNGKRIVGVYPYHGSDGELRFEVIRYEPKKFSQRQPDGQGGYIWNLKGVDRVPYRLPELIAANPDATVFIPEGEKHVDALMAHGLVATTNPQGAGKWNAQFNQWLKGRHVVILPDNDDTGRKHAAEVAASLRGKAASIRVLPLPGLNEKGDVINWFAAGHTAFELVDLAQEAQEAANDDQPEDEPARTSVDGVIAGFNARYMVVNDGGKTVVFEEAFNPVLRRRYFLRLNFEDFRRLYLNYRVVVGEDDDCKVIIKNAAEVWLRSTRRRQFIGGVVFDPACRNVPADTLNLWKCFAVKPRQGTWHKMQRHLLEIICGGSEEMRDYVLNWSARLIQFPAEQGEVAIVMRGREGCGKGIYARTLRFLLGQHGMAISNPKHLTGTFNAHLRDCVFLFADEAFYAGDKAHVGVLKAIVTEPTITIEGKYLNATEVPNFLHIIMASNNDWVVPAAIESRRWAVLDVLATKCGDLDYFAEIVKELEGGGYEAMLYDLLHRDISQFNPRKVPETAGLIEQRKLSLPTAESWWFDVLHRGYVFASKLGMESFFTVWTDEVTTELLFASYLTFAQLHRERHPMSRETFGRFMRHAAKGQQRRLKDAAVGEHVVDFPNPNGGTGRRAELDIRARPWGYQVGSLDNARTSFEETTGLKFEWPDDSADDANG